MDEAVSSQASLTFEADFVNRGWVWEPWSPPSADVAGLDPLWLLRAFRRCLPLGRHGT